MKWHLGNRLEKAPAEGNREKTTVAYADTWIPVFLIPFVTGIHYYLTYPEIQFNSYFLVTSICDLVKGLTSWYICRLVITWLEVNYPWPVFLTKRLILQLIGTLLFGVGTISLLTEIDYAWIRQRPIEKSGFYSFDLILVFIWVLVINGIYISLYFYQFYQEKLTTDTLEAAESTDSTKNVTSPFIVKLGKQEIRLDWEELLLFYIEQQTVLLLTTNQKKYVIDFSLDTLETQLNSTLFFRANRQCILTRAVVKSFTKEGNGKLLVTLQEFTGAPGQIQISRLRAPAFKKWLKAE